MKKVLGRKFAARVLKTWFEDFVDEDTGEVVSIERNEIIFDRDTILEKEHIDEIIEAGVQKRFYFIKKIISRLIMRSFTIHCKKIQQTLKKKLLSISIDNLRNAEPPDEETARGIIDKLFFSEQRYNLGEVGRFRMNTKLGLDVDIDSQSTYQVMISLPLSSI